MLVTRPREQARDLVERLQALGADTVEAPMIRITPPDDPTALLKAAQIRRISTGSFTSANSVEGFMTALLSQHRDVRALKGPRLCTVGPGTAERLRRYSVVADAVPDEYRAEAVLGTLAAHGPLAGVRVLLPRSDIGREVIAEQLRSAGASVTDVTAYRTILDEVQREGDPDIYGMMLEGRIDIVTFTSASAVRNSSVYGADQVADLLRTTIVAVIGPVTADAARQAGITVSVQPGCRSPSAVWSTHRHITQKRACGKIEPMKVTLTYKLSLTQRPRRLRRTEAIRRILAETRLTPDCLSTRCSSATAKACGAR